MKTKTLMIKKLNQYKNFSKKVAEIIGYDDEISGVILDRYIDLKWRIDNENELSVFNKNSTYLFYIVSDFQGEKDGFLNKRYPPSQLAISN